MSKVLERLIHGQLSAYLKRMNFLCENQSGFRRNHSTATAVTHFTDNILTNIDKGLITGTVFTDFSKAFDTVEHDILLNKLEHYGVCSQSLRWFKDYLHERKQTVSIDTERSDELDIVTGVPRGSILGPLLFIIYINDMPNCIENCSVNLYADDTVIYYSGVSNRGYRILRKERLEVPVAMVRGQQVGTKCTQNEVNAIYLKPPQTQGHEFKFMSPR